VALQIEYSLIERTGERDLIPMAREMGLGVTPYSPLGGGVLTGKYSRDDLTGANLVSEGSTRGIFNAALGTVIERNLDIADVLRGVAGELGCTPAQAGLAWTLQNPDVTAPVIGARTPAQLEENLGALEVDLTADQLTRLNEVSAIDLGFPHRLLASDHIRTVTAGELKVKTRR
jgi:aryl-alcohol dehydrogenase-like predicted oxidoreductase